MPARAAFSEDDGEAMRSKEICGLLRGRRVCPEGFQGCFPVTTCNGDDR